jgi:hypothetical protein
MQWYAHQRLATRHRPPRVDSGGLFGCAGILLLLAGVLAFGGYNNHQ